MILPLILAIAQATAPTAPPARELARGVALISGAVPADRGPDGNTVIFDAPDGLVVVDTGRHPWHSDAILNYASERQRAIVAIVNTHWHLDHTSGNRRIKAIFPAARLHTTNAIDRVLTPPDGFLVRNLERARTRYNEPDIPPVEREERGFYLETMAHPEFLRPDVTLDRSQRMRIGGRRFDVHVTDGAVSEADVWLYDRRSRTAVIGDLVTFPAPFFESACPDRWRAELDAVWETPFRTVIPGHGTPMNREQFGAWRAAFGAFIDCVNSDTEAAQCASGWANGIAQFLGAGEDAAALEYANYYVGMLRENGGTSPDCVP